MNQQVNVKWMFRLTISTAICAFMALTSTALARTPARATFCQRLIAQPDPWVAKRVDALVKTARRAYESDAALPAYEKVLDRIMQTMRRCKLAEDKGFISRYRSFVEYVDTVGLERRPGHELGFAVDDEQYFSETRHLVEIPGFLLEQKFLRSVSRYETLARAKRFLKELNSRRAPAEQLIFFSYKSRHLGTPDNNDSYRRLLIVVPGNSQQGVPEKWVQFGVSDPRVRSRVRNISVVSALPGPDGTFNAYFKDFYRTYRRNGFIKVDGRWELDEGDDNCAQCHKSGILPIFPVRATVKPAELSALREVNERFRTYGSPRFGRYLNPKTLGPGLSAASLKDRRRRFGRDFEKTAAAQAMVCSSCHTPDRVGALNWPMDKTLISSYVKGGQMPRGHKLKSADRRELYAKLIQEYFATDKDQPGILKSWLLSNRQ
jgi:mono/diheme cytochrome c family protein